MTEYYDLGSYSRSISTPSHEAQLWFDRGLNWTYGYHHEEAIECFAKALEHDPDCLMAHWGIAYASGPNYNKTWEDLEDEEKTACVGAAHNLLESTKDKLAQANDIERDLIEALLQRYPDDDTIEDFAPWNDSYANAMREVYKSHPEDLDVCTLFAESIMNTMPTITILSISMSVK